MVERRVEENGVAAHIYLCISEHVQIIAQGPIWGMSVIEETVN